MSLVGEKARPWTKPFTCVICVAAPPASGCTQTSVRPPSSLRYATSFSSCEKERRIPERLLKRRILKYSSRATGATGAFLAGAGAAAACAAGAAAVDGGLAADGGATAELPPQDKASR